MSVTAFFGERNEENIGNGGGSARNRGRDAGNLSGNARNLGGNAGNEAAIKTILGNLIETNIIDLFPDGRFLTLDIP